MSTVPVLRRHPLVGYFAQAGPAIGTVRGPATWPAVGGMARRRRLLDQLRNDGSPLVGVVRRVSPLP